ncbi:MAG: hypothetical protein FJZ88_03190 [Chloroflexi bacterium]|nr:hypothetical protein [Chloroflexota bacterium]
MTDLAIRVDHLSKRYHIGCAQQRHDALRDALEAVFSSQSSVFSRQFSVVGHLWALKTVN